MRGQEGHSASGGGGIKMAEYVVGSKAAAQLHRETGKGKPNWLAFTVRRWRRKMKMEVVWSVSVMKM